MLAILLVVAVFTVVKVVEVVGATVNKVVVEAVEVLDVVVVPSSLGACGIEKAIEVLVAEEIAVVEKAAMVSKIDALCEQAIKDIDVCAANSESRFGFHADSMKVKFAVEEELLRLTFGTEFRAYSSAKYDEIFNYVQTLKGSYIA